MNDETKNRIITGLAIVGVITAFILPFWGEKQGLIGSKSVAKTYNETGVYSNRSDYISSCYVLTPKKKAYFYQGKNSVSNGSQVKTIVIPDKTAISRTVEDTSGLFTPNTNANDPFLTAWSEHRTHIDLENNLTINSNYEYPLNENAQFIKVVPIKYLYRYKRNDFLSLKFFVAPTNAKYVNDEDFPSHPIRYLKMSEFTLKYQKHYNISKSKDQICLGYINR